MFSGINTIWWPLHKPGHTVSASNGKIWEIEGPAEGGGGRMGGREGGGVKSVAPHKLLRIREAGAELMLYGVGLPHVPLLTRVPFLSLITI